MSTVLEFRNVVRGYGESYPVINDVSFSVEQGEVVGLLGRNGAGKTTLIRLAMGLLHPQEGSVHVFGLSPTDHPVEVKKRVGYVAEDQVLPTQAVVDDVIEFHRRLFPQWDVPLERQLWIQLDIKLGATIGKLSKGEARRVALLCAVCHKPELLILDEPAGGLDPAVRREFLEVAVQLLNREGTTILFSSHQMGDLERIGSRVVLLDSRRVCLDESIERLREEYCVAMAPCSAIPNSAVLERVPGCLRVRHILNDWHAVFRRPPDVAAAELRQALGIDGIRCVQVTLEDLFVEMVGAKH
jgi:ABC-2 type transport system ATP-binding protein